MLAASTVGGTSHQVPPVPHPASVSCSQVSSSAAESPPGDKDDDEDEELDLLLGLKTPDSGVSGNQSVSVPDEESSVPQRGERIQIVLLLSKHEARQTAAQH